MSDSEFVLPRRAVLASGAALGLAAACGHAPTPWEKPAAQPFRVVEHTWIPMRDGVRLSARLWIPEGAQRHPAVLEYIPYRKRDLYRAYDDIWGKTLAEAGIAFARVDVRGSGDSEGVITDEYSEHELEDGEAIIAWLARQDWCTGAVGMRGLSWGGINTLQIAARRPPALKAIMPMGCCDNRYTDDAHYIGGALGRTNFQWGVVFKNVMAGPPDPTIVGDAWRTMWQQRLDATPSILATWLQHQRKDAYWNRGSVSENYAAIDIPTYLVSGWNDTYAVPVLRLLEKLKSPAKALIGPWGHTYPNLATPQGLDWAYEEIRWWRHWLMGEATGIMNEPRLRCFMPTSTTSEVQGAAIPGRWIAESNWPTRTSTHRYFLNTGALASTAIGGAPIIHRDKGIVGTTKPEWLDRPPIEQSHDDQLSTIFDTAPLAADLEILGAPKVKLALASDTPIANVVLRLNEVCADGKSWLVTWGVLNLTRRKSMSQPTPLEAGQAYDLDIDLRPIAHRFTAGSRIRLSLSESQWPMIWPSPATPTFTIASGQSTLILPVRAAERAPAPFPIPETNSAAQPPATYQPSSPDATGRIRIVNATPAYAYKVGGADSELSSAREEICEITAGDPLSSKWQHTTTSTWKRPGWDCRLQASYTLTCDATSFHLEESLQAWSNGEPLTTLRNKTTLPRDLI